MNRRLARPLLALAAAASAGLAVLALNGSASAAVATVTPGTMWTDTAGNRLQAHGAGVFTVGSTYYMVGEDKSAGATFTAVACYSSTDLVHWTRQTDALSRQASGDLAAGRIVERPKVLYNSATGKYVMWLHIDNTSYQDRRAGVATSTTPCGPYTYLGATDPLGHQSRDLGLFKDSDGTAYLMHDDPAGSLRIDRLSADYTTAQSAVATFPEIEAPAIAKVGGRYFLLGSHLTGWATNDNVYASATSLSGPWSGFTNVAPAGTSTYNSQTSFLLPVTGSAGTSYVYIGDRWNSSDLNSSLPVWLPITLTGNGTAALSWYPSWGIDTATGSLTLPTYRLKGVQSNRCLTIANASQANGAGAQISDCASGANQTFAPSAASELRVYGSKCLQAEGTGAGATVDIWDCTGADNQKWMLSSDGSIVGVQSRLCLDVNGQATANGSVVQLWTCNGGANQNWSRTEATGATSPTPTSGASSSAPPSQQNVEIVGGGSGRCIDINNSSTTNGTQAQLWDCTGGSNQRWTYTSNKQLVVYGNKCLDASGQGTSNGTPTVIWDCNGQANQQWNINANGTITGVQSGLCLDANGAGTANGTRIALWSCNGGSNQQWSLRS